MPIDTLNTAGFSLIGVLWAGYFVLEGFDFSVGILSPLLSHDDLERRLCINTIGPVWDGNEVWLIVAGGATFAAFPDWYATMFSGFYLALFLILAGHIVRGVSFEFRGKDRAPAWRATWDRTLFVGSLIPALLWGVAFTNLIHGLDIGAGFHYLGGFVGLIHPMAVLGGLAGLSLFVLHGAVFLAAKTGGDLSERARRAARLMAVPTVALFGGLVAWVALAAGPRAAQTLPRVVPLAFAAVAVAPRRAHPMVGRPPA
jgi:cytochrome bd ubiquinol oxidase subunit II